MYVFSVSINIKCINIYTRRVDIDPDMSMDSRNRVDRVLKPFCSTGPVCSNNSLNFAFTVLYITFNILFKLISEKMKTRR